MYEGRGIGSRYIHLTSDSEQLLTMLSMFATSVWDSQLVKAAPVSEHGKSEISIHPFLFPLSRQSRSSVHFILPPSSNLLRKVASGSQSPSNADKCYSVLVPVSVVSNNVRLSVPEPANQTVVTEII